MSRPDLTIQDPPDIVATNGAHLATQPNTPVSHFPQDAEATDKPFEEKLTEKLLAAFTQQAVRYKKYGNVSLEYPPGHTPPEIREERERELELQCELDDACSRSYSPENDGMPTVFDIVATDGCYLVTKPNTPIYYLRRLYEHNARQFAIDLIEKLKWALARQSARRVRYGDAALEYHPRFTPPELRGKHERMMALLEEPNATSFPWDTSDEDEDIEPGPARRNNSATSSKPEPRAEKAPATRSHMPSPTQLKASFPDSTSAPAPCNGQSRPLASDSSAFEATTTKERKRRHSDATEGDEPQSRSKSARKAAPPLAKLRRSARLRCRR